MDSKEVAKKEEEKKGFSQAGGHEGAFLKAADGRIMKKVSKNEFTFYSQTLSKFPKVQPFLPKYFGTETRDGQNYVILQDLTSIYQKPCILDIKIGLTSVGEDATPEKAEAMRKKDMGTTTCTLGMRITAMKVYSVKEDKFDSYGKPWGKKVTDDTMLDSLKVFFNNGQTIRAELAAHYVKKLKPLLEYFENQSDLRFYSSSLLFLYDGHGQQVDNADVRMIGTYSLFQFECSIDFAHVHEIKDGGKDTGYITGLKNLISFLEKIK